ncbi:10278_t:CDS:2, partial [Entrophospora sp. SA101]
KMLKKISDYLGVKIHVQIVDEPLEDEGQVLQEIGNYKNINNNDLLLEIVRRNTWNATNEFKNNTLCLVNENITAVELGEIIGKP